MSLQFETNKIQSALNKRYNDYNRWLFLLECPVGTGAKSTNFIDAFVMSCYPSDKNIRIAFEIKVSRNDFKKEILNPKKRRPALFISNEFYFVTPKGLLKPEEIPSDCGLMEMNDDGDLRIILAAPYRDSVRPTWNFVAALFRRITNRNTKAQEYELALKELKSKQDPTALIVDGVAI